MRLLPYSIFARWGVTAGLLLGLVLSARAQTPHLRGVGDARAFIDIGPCRTLRDTVYVLPLLTTLPGTPWPDTATAYALAETEAALRWLEARAAENGIPLVMQMLPPEPYTAPCPDTLNGKALSHKWLYHRPPGQPSIAQRQRRTRRGGGPQLAPIFLHHRPGHSYARCMYGPFGGLGEAVYIYRYLQHANGTVRVRSLRTVIAHEMLHLFGATDLYFPLSRKHQGENWTLARQVFPKEIMFASYLPLDQVHISPITAYLIGWRKDFPEEHFRYLKKRQ